MAKYEVTLNHTSVVTYQQTELVEAESQEAAEDAALERDLVFGENDWLTTEVEDVSVVYVKAV
jgi:hypothetical protein